MGECGIVGNVEGVATGYVFCRNDIFISDVRVRVPYICDDCVW